MFAASNRLPAWHAEFTSCSRFKPRKPHQGERSTACRTCGGTSSQHRR